MVAARHWRGCAALALLLAAQAPARAGQEEAPICNRPEVLDAVAAGLVARGSTAELERDAAGQVPGGQPGLVLCAVRMRLQYFDTNRFGYRPLYTYGVHLYYVRAGRNGYFVSDGGG